MLTAAQLEAAARAHFEAERIRSLEAIEATLHEGVEYHVLVPSLADDPTPPGRSDGAGSVIDLWARIYDTFSTYDIDVEGLTPLPGTNQVWARVCITATPAVAFEGLPAGQPLRWYSAALCDFDEEGRLTRETVYGTLPSILWGLARIRERLAAGDGAAE